MFLLDKLFSITCLHGEEKTKDVTTQDPEKVKGNEDISENRIKNTYCEALVHMFRATVGTGVLALPAAFSQAGYLSGVLGVIFVSYITNYCNVILAESQSELSRRVLSPIPTYQSTVEAAFKEGPPTTRSYAPFFMRSTNVLILIGQIGGVCVYVLFIASNVKAALELSWELRLMTLAVALPILAVNMIRRLKRLALISSAGNAVLLASVAVVLYYCLSGGPPPRTPVRPFGRIENLPHFFGTVFFACGAITMVLPLGSEMQNPEKLTGPAGVLNVNAALTGALYAVFGTLGYLKYGDEAAGSVTLNLPPGQVLAKVVQLLLALATLTGTALQNYVSVSILWEDYLDKRIHSHRLLAQYLLRTALVLLTVMVALVVPKLELLVSVSGTLSQVTVNSTLPCIVHYLVFYKQPSLWATVKTFYRDFIVILFSILVLCVGGYTTTIEVKRHFSQG